jgi:hypothetical protein
VHARRSRTRERKDRIKECKTKKHKSMECWNRNGNSKECKTRERNDKKCKTKGNQANRRKTGKCKVGNARPGNPWPRPRKTKPRTKRTSWIQNTNSLAIEKTYAVEIEQICRGDRKNYIVGSVYVVEIEQKQHRGDSDNLHRELCLRPGDRKAVPRGDPNKLTSWR